MSRNLSQANCEQLTVKCVRLEDVAIEYLYLHWKTRWLDCCNQSFYKIPLIDPSILHFVQLLKVEIQKPQTCETYVVSIAQILTIHAIRSIKNSEESIVNCLIEIQFS